MSVVRHMLRMADMLLFIGPAIINSVYAVHVTARFVQYVLCVQSETYFMLQAFVPLSPPNKPCLQLSANLLLPV